MSIYIYIYNIPIWNYVLKYVFQLPFFILVPNAFGWDWKKNTMDQCLAFRHVWKKWLFGWSNASNGRTDCTWWLISKVVQSTRKGKQLKCKHLKRLANIFSRWDLWINICVTVRKCEQNLTLFLITVYRLTYHRVRKAKASRIFHKSSGLVQH